ncbi:hypothetical protein ENINMMO181B_21225 [Enterobacter intestinihominis]|nr:hypothetical protein L361_00047 [Enterobacter sp. MGH 15]EUM88407.1 hypothetical protein L352_07692 [Enterobacter sp. MGH 6]EUN08444.1 hypothetical protein L347_07118 [Enterobacter sp. MGH 1]CZV98236.1 Uncharacterised protein [Enterobacter hormaechei]
MVTENPWWGLNERVMGPQRTQGRVYMNCNKNT